jgi:hypothetical protein
MGLSEGGHPITSRKIAVMMHTFIDDQEDRGRRLCGDYLYDYLLTAARLEKAAGAGGGVTNAGHTMPSGTLSDRTLEEISLRAVENHLNKKSLIGTTIACKRLVSELEFIGVTEIACLVDFVSDRILLKQSIESLRKFVQYSSTPSDSQSSSEMERFLR